MVSLSKSSKKLIGIMIVVSLIAIGVASVYYKNLNATVDPRTAEIQQLQKKYSMYVSQNDFENVLSVLDSIETMYNEIPHYKDSYEVGVLNANRASVYITSALYIQRDEDEKEGYLVFAESSLEKSLSIYDAWNAKYSELNDIELNDLIRSEFDNNTGNKIIIRRIKEIRAALVEINRRYSVAFTNLGIVKRHQEKQLEAIELYKKAIDLWGENHTAKSNLNVLLGGDPIKQSFIKKLFPPEKE
jgi:tetratricopeptide (TPR) repeat protein